MRKADEAHFEPPPVVSCRRRLQLKPICLSLVASAFIIIFITERYTKDDIVVDRYVVSSGGVHKSQLQVIHISNQCESQAHRQQLVATACDEHQQLRSTGRSWNFKVDIRHGLMYCPIPKAGWSSWKRLLFYINGAINSTDIEIGITSDSTAGILDFGLLAAQRMQSTQPKFLFAFVRDPWRRLVSAYINKALDWNYTRILHTPCKWETMEPYRDSITFTQFLTCIADAGTNTLGLDIHWAPMWQLCDFCHLRYDYIGHLETVFEDAEYIIKRNGLNVTFPRIFSSKAYRADEVIESWYMSVPLAVIRKLRTMYMYDFQLHGYSDVPPGWKGKLS